jgi:alpha-beta hydrolase superfamily lysophospholipase
METPSGSTGQPTKSNPSRPTPGEDTYRSALLLPQGYPHLPTHWSTTTESHSPQPEVALFLARHQSAEASRKAKRRTLLIVHGLGEHGGRYYHFPHFLSQTFDEIVCMDQRGHGRSSGIRGHVDAFDALPADVASVARHLLNEPRHGACELHLFGHSLGGHVVLRTLFNHPELPFRSATVSAPFLGIAAPVPAIKKLAAQALSYVWGRLQLNTEVEASGLSHDPAVAEAYLADQLVHSKMTPTFFRSMSEAMKDTLSRQSGIQVPLLFQVPLQDKLVKADLALQIFGQLQHAQKRLKTYPNLYHEIFNELEKDTVFEDFRQWIESQSTRGPLDVPAGNA